MSPTKYDGNNTALLLLDFHEGNVEHCGEAGEDAVEIAAELIEWAHDNSMIVVHCLIDHKGKGDPLLHGTMLKILADGPGEASALEENWESMDTIERRSLSDESAYDTLGEFLEANDQYSLVIAGLNTSGIVLATAIDALDFGHVVTIISNASVDPQRNLKEYLSAKLPFRRFHIMTKEELLNMFELQRAEEIARASHRHKRARRF